MADETIPTPNSEPTPNPTPSDPPAADPAPASDPAPKQDEGDDLGGTALGGAGEDPKPAEAKDEGKSDEGGVPEAYELATPEGFEKLDDDIVAAATPVFKDLGLSNEQANKIMPLAGQFAQKIVADRDQQFLGQIMEQRKSWLEEAKADKEIGGQNWDASLTDSGRALDRLGFPKGSPLRTALDDSGFGNHPEMLRFFARAGKAIGEDSDFVRSDANASIKPKSDAELFYGSKKD